MNLDLLLTERSVYSMLDWIGDIGGLFDGLRLFFFAILSIWNYKFYESYFISYLYRMEDNDPLSSDINNSKQSGLMHRLSDGARQKLENKSNKLIKRR